MSMNTPTDEQSVNTKLMRALVNANGGDKSVRMATAYFAGMTMREIAAEHECSHVAVHKRVHRLRHALRDAGVLPLEWQTMRR